MHHVGCSVVACSDRDNPSTWPAAVFRTLCCCTHQTLTIAIGDIVSFVQRFVLPYECCYALLTSPVAWHDKAITFLLFPICVEQCYAPMLCRHTCRQVWCTADYVRYLWYCTQCEVFCCCCLIGLQAHVCKPGDTAFITRSLWQHYSLVQSVLLPHQCQSVCFVDKLSNTAYVGHCLCFAVKLLPSAKCFAATVWLQAVM